MMDTKRSDFYDSYFFFHMKERITTLILPYAELFLFHTYENKSTELDSQSILST
jgi:hypothetical protein